MFSPLNNTQLEQWFQCLDAPLKRLPAEERANLHQEVRQHLEALVAAHEELGSSPAEALELALQQFGNPSKFGKRMAQEWQQGKPSLRADLAAIFACFGLQALLAFSSAGLVDWWRLSHHDAHFLKFIFTTNYGLFLAGLVVFPAMIGRKFPFQATKGVFYSRVLSSICWWFYAVVQGSLHPISPHPMLVALIRSMPWTPVWLSAALGVAYLASVTKRGWYRPTWEDFKITLPKRRKIAG